jgi:Cytochrome P450
MSSTLSLLIGSLFLTSLPYWLPAVVIRLRMRIFTRINGEEALQLPNRQFGPDVFRRVYSHATVTGRSRGARLSDLFWYWLAPGPEMHQEHLENGPRYEQIAELTRKILAVPRSAVETLLERCAAGVWPARNDTPWEFVRLRDMMMPLWASFYYELVFRKECPPATRQLIVDNANDVVTALKCCGLRHMKKRAKLTAVLLDKVQAGELPHAFPPGFTALEQAYYLQGTYFNTAIVQMSEAMAHLLMTLAQHPAVQEQLASSPEDRPLHDRVIDESLRLYPLFGIAHRITIADLQLDGVSIGKNSVVCFNYPEYHKAGYAQPDAFRPDRWQQCPAKEANFIPFGISANRPCPAHGIALVSMRRLLTIVLRRYRFATAAEHSRSLPNRAPCLRSLRHERTLPAPAERLLLLWMKISDRWESVFRSVVQLILGTMMIIDARRLRLCERHFAGLENRCKQPIS